MSPHSLDQGERMANTSGESSEQPQQVTKGQRVSRILVPDDLGHESRGQKIAGGARPASAPASKPPMTALPPTAQQTQQMSHEPAAPAKE